ncbi:MAG: DNA polymerase III subunit delta' [Pseudomonadota bacterium]
MSDAALPTSDRIEGAPHPRDTAQLFGQASAEADFLGAFNTGRLHHGWLVTGPRGIGKATLAYRIARFLLTRPVDAPDGLFGAPEEPASREVSPDHPVARRIAAGAEPGLFVLKRGGAGSTEGDRHKNLEAGKFAQDIRVDDVRKLNEFFNFSAAGGGRRVVIVDAADEMNVQAANALLKRLEEPPANTTLLLISHQPTRLLPTIRSRCRELRLDPLAPDDIRAAMQQAMPDAEEDMTALTALTSGSVGEAIRLANLSGLAIYAELTGLFGTLPRMDRSRAVKLAEAAAQRGGGDRLDLLIDLLGLLLARLARSGTMGHAPALQAVPGEAEMLMRLSPDPQHARKWADVASETGAKLRHGRAVNLDPAALILDTLRDIEQAAA